MIPQIDAVQIRQLVKKHGTPLYVYDADVLRQRSAQLQGIVSGASLYYSLKANPNKDVAATLRLSGCRVEVASGGELKRAIAAGYAASEIMFIGPGKTRSEIATAAELGIDRFVVDNSDELRILRDETEVRRVTVRVNPDFEAKGGKLTMSGGKPKQFGVDRPQLRDFVDFARSLAIDVTGLHYYLGTRFLNAQDIVVNTQRIVADAKSIAVECGLSLEMLDMGGGFGVPYFDSELFLDLEILEAGLGRCIAEAKCIFPEAQLAFESGRYLTAESGQLILEILACKTSYGTRFCICDGGTNLNLAAIGTGSLGKRNFPSYLIPRVTMVRDQNGSGPVNVTGPLCTPDDLLLKSVQWQCDPQPGDFVVLSRVGAYGPTASPHSFLGHQYPNETLI